MYTHELTRSLHRQDNGCGSSRIKRMRCLCPSPPSLFLFCLAANHLPFLPAGGAEKEPASFIGNGDGLRYAGRGVTKREYAAWRSHIAHLVK